MFTTAGKTKSWCARTYGASSAQGLLEDYKDWKISADLPDFDEYPEAIKATRMIPDIVISSASSRKIIMVELTVPYESRMEEANIFKREKYSDLSKELKRAGFDTKILPVEIGARGFVATSAFDLLSKLYIRGSRRTKTLKILGETAENSSRWIWSRRNHQLLHK